MRAFLVRCLCLLCLFMAVAHAQPVPPPQPPPKAADLQATEGILLEQVTSRRDWWARAISLQTANDTLTKQLADANSKVDILTKTVKDLQDGIAKAHAPLPPHAPPSAPAHTE